MTEDEFFGKLAACSSSPWKVTTRIGYPHGQMHEYGFIRRTKLTPFAVGGVFFFRQHDCPICAVAHACGDARYGNANYLDAARYMGLDESLAKEIAQAADSPWTKIWPGSRLAELRARLEEATRLPAAA